MGKLNQQGKLSTLTMSSIIMIILLNTYLIGTSEAYSQGAPVRSCYTLLPSPKSKAHGYPSNETSPYRLVIDAQDFTPYKLITVKVISKHPKYLTYNGIMIQARRVNKVDGTVPRLDHYLNKSATLSQKKPYKVEQKKVLDSIVGNWVSFDATYLKPLSCHRHYYEEVLTGSKNKSSLQDEMSLKHLVSEKKLRKLAKTVPNKVSNQTNEKSIRCPLPSYTKFMGSDTLTHLSNMDIQANGTATYVWTTFYKEEDLDTKIRFVATIMFNRKKYWLNVVTNDIPYKPIYEQN